MGKQCRTLLFFNFYLLNIYIYFFSFFTLQYCIGFAIHQHASATGDFTFWGSKITADGDCSHEIKRCLFLGRKVMTNWNNILKSRDITLPTKVRLVKAMVFPVVMNGCESWTIKKAEC